MQLRTGGWSETPGQPAIGWGKGQMGQGGDRGLTFAPMTDVSLASVCDVMNRGYEGYIIPARFDVAALARRMLAEHIDPVASRILLDSAGLPVGVLMIARRDRISRIAALGIVPDCRGAGLGARSVALAIDEARARSDLALRLEVIEGNAAAIATYERAGFTVRRRLVGYDHAPVRAAAGAVSACDIAAALPLLLRAWPADTGWQTWPAGHASACSPVLAFRQAEGMAAALVDASGPAVRVMSFAVAPEARRRGIGRAFMRDLLGQFPGRPWAIPAILPETQAQEFLGATGWQQSALRQFEMEIPLAAQGTNGCGAGAAPVA